MARHACSCSVWSRRRLRLHGVAFLLQRHEAHLLLRQRLRGRLAPGALLRQLRLRALHVLARGGVARFDVALERGRLLALAAGVGEVVGQPLQLLRKALPFPGAARAVARNDVCLLLLAGEGQLLLVQLAAERLRLKPGQHQGRG